MGKPQPAATRVIVISHARAAHAASQLLIAITPCKQHVSYTRIQLYISCVFVKIGVRICLAFFLIYKEEIHVRSGHPRFRYFACALSEKGLSLKSLKGQTKADKLGKQLSEFLSLHLPLN
jgi:hypothetical protein